METDADLAQNSDYILSIVPPRDAEATAQRIISALSARPRASDAPPLYYLDLNAIAPSTAEKINGLFSGFENIRVIDGGIIGLPPKAPAGGSSGAASTDWYRPSIPLSGPFPLASAPVSGSVLAAVLNSYHVNDTIGSASGLKCVFASLSKGFIALGIQSFSTAHALGVLPALKAEMATFNPAVLERVEKGLVGMGPKAYRWVREMEEIGACFAENGGWDEGHGKVFDEIAKVYQVVSEETILGREKADGPDGVARAVSEGLLKQ